MENTDRVGQTETIHAHTLSQAQTPTHQELLSLFKENRRNGNIQDSSLSEFVELLGGFDAVMDVVLKAPDYSMADDNCVAMKQRLLEPLPNKSKDDRLIWTVDPNDNVLHQISPFIHRHLLTKPVILTMVALYVFMSLLEPVALAMIIPSAINSKPYEVFWKILMLVYMWCCYFPFFIAALLNVNKTLIPKIAGSADFWITFGSAFALQVYVGIWRYLDLSESDSLFLDIVFFIHTLTGILLFVMFICCMDGLHGINNKVKVFGLNVMALLCLFSSFQYQYVHPEKVIDIDRLGDYGRFSVNANISGSYWVLFLFLMKMAFKTSWRGNSRCILLKHSPAVQWKEPSKDDIYDEKPRDKSEPRGSMDGIDFVHVPTAMNPNASSASTTQLTSPRSVQAMSLDTARTIDATPLEEAQSKPVQIAIQLVQEATK